MTSTSPTTQVDAVDGPGTVTSAPPALGAGEFEISGRRYVTLARLAEIFHVSARTIGRWEAERIGPPRIKLGKLILYDLAKVPAWLEAQETHPLRLKRGR